MILEHAVLEVRPEQRAAFESAMAKALPFIKATPGFIALEVKPCRETLGRYLLLVQWQSVADHEVGFRTSDRYQEWKALLHGFYDPMPLVQHYGDAVVTG